MHVESQPVSTNSDKPRVSVDYAPAPRRLKRQQGGEVNKITIPNTAQEIIHPLFGKFKKPEQNKYDWAKKTIRQNRAAYNSLANQASAIASQGCCPGHGVQGESSSAEGHKNCEHCKKCGKELVSGKCLSCSSKAIKSA